LVEGIKTPPAQADSICHFKELAIRRTSHRNEWQVEGGNPKLGQVFDSGSNALNALRLALAAEVMLWHSWLITGRLPPAATVQLLFSVGVDGFFAISGFLIARSWLRNPQIREYLVARALRILPGFYVCLGVTAFVLAPISVAIQGGSATELVLSGAPIDYVLKNSAVAIFKLDVGGTPSGIPAPGAWNSSLWSLIYEVVCYLGVAVLGVVGLARRRWHPIPILALAVFGATLLPPLTYRWPWTIEQCTVRAVIMFAAGALLYQFRDVIPARWSLVAASVAAVLAAGVLLPDYRIVAAIPLAYAVVVSGALVHNERLRLRTDLSYGVYIYAFPIQQMLAVCGLAGLGPFAFFGVTAAATLPFAAASWFLVERPMIAMRSRLKSATGLRMGSYQRKLRRTRYLPPARPTRSRRPRRRRRLR
jgi:peptidoglycan/LPS O-acetylase OafA/YrhL